MSSRYLLFIFYGLLTTFTCLGCLHMAWSQPLDKKSCLHRWPSITLPAAEINRLTEKGVLIIDSSGEHPTLTAVSQIVDHLSKAAAANSTVAQQRLGSYVFGYWMTDFMFWPKHKRVAVDALAMLRVYAMKELAFGPPHGPLLQGLGVTPPFFDEHTSDLPRTWVDLAVKTATHWQKCFVLIKGYSPIL